MVDGLRLESFFLGNLREFPIYSEGPSMIAAGKTIRCMSKVCENQPISTVDANIVEGFQRVFGRSYDNERFTP